MVEPAGENISYTYEDLLTWPEEERWELIDGVPYDMTPAPSLRHQDILGRLYRQFGDFLDGAPCRVILAPFDVRLPKASESWLTTTTVVQPDLTVICEREKLDDHGYVGAPTLVVEILSSYTSPKDLRVKLQLYERVGVKEYWVVYPGEKVIQIYTLNEHGRYDAPAIAVVDDQLPVGVLPGLVIDLARVFAEV